MAQEVPADALGDEFKGYVLRITGGNDVRFASLLCAPLIVVSREILTMLLIRMFHFNSSIRLAKITKFENSLPSLPDNPSVSSLSFLSARQQKQGFPLKQGVLVPHRVKLLLAKGHSCYRPRRTGERKRKSVRGCIVGPDVRALHLVVVKQGESDIPGLTDEVLPKRLGPKRATKIRRFFNLDKSDDVRKFVIRREVVPKKEGAKPYTKA